MKEYEEGQKAAKLEEIRKLYEAKGFQPWVTLERIMNPSWLNKSYSLKKVEADLSTIQHSIGEDILIINQMGEGQPAALREYQRTLSKTAAVEAGNRYIEARYAEQRLAETVRKEQEEAARKKQAEIDRDLGITEPVPAPEPVRVAPAQTVSQEGPEVKKISFSIWVTREQLAAVNRCLKENGIRFEQIKRGKAGIARTFQNIRLFGNLTVLDNVKTGFHNVIPYSPITAILRLPKYFASEKEINEKAMDLLKIMELDKYADYKASNLPYGAQRRLEIARALATNPKLLLLDEPAAGMNPQETAELMDMIRFVRDHFKIAVLLIEHDMKLVMGICERITVLNYGMMLAQGTGFHTRIAAEAPTAITEPAIWRTMFFLAVSESASAQIKTRAPKRRITDTAP